MARSRFRRSKVTLPPLRLTARDDAVLDDVHRFGCALVAHLQALHFPSYKTAAERAMKLFHHRYLDRLALEVETGQPAMIHVLGEAGRARLAARGVEVGRGPSEDEPRALARAVDVAEVLTAIAVAGRQPGVELPLVEARPPIDDEAPVRPDAGVVVDVPSKRFRRVLLLDVDGRGEVAQGERFAAWRAWASGGPVRVEQALGRMLARRGVAAVAGRARVSIGVVAHDDARLDALARLANLSGCGPLVHLARFDRLRGEGAFAAVWQQAKARAEHGAAAPVTSVLE